MCAQEFPHFLGTIELLAGLADEAFRQIFRAARPRMAATANFVQAHFAATLALAADVKHDGGAVVFHLVGDLIVGALSALVERRPPLEGLLGGPGRAAFDAELTDLPAAPRNDRILGAIQNRDRNGPRRLASRPDVLRKIRRDRRDGSENILGLTRETERHEAAVRDTRRIDALRVHAIARAELANQRAEE